MRINNIFPRNKFLRTGKEFAIAVTPDPNKEQDLVWLRLIKGRQQGRTVGQIVEGPDKDKIVFFENRLAAKLSPGQFAVGVVVGRQERYWMADVLELSLITWDEGTSSAEPTGKRPVYRAKNLLEAKEQHEMLMRTVLQRLMSRIPA